MEYEDEHSDYRPSPDKLWLLSEDEDEDEDHQHSPDKSWLLSELVKLISSNIILCISFLSPLKEIEPWYENLGTCYLYIW